MQIEMTEVHSSNIKAVGFHKDVNFATGTLRIQFHNGSVYDYPGVRDEVAAGMLRAPSIGKYFFANIKGHYQATKVEG